MTPLQLAEKYHHDVHAAARAGLSVEPEAQLTAPVKALFEAVASAAGLGTVTLLREARTGRTRPDFGVLQSTKRGERQRGYVELKAPNVSVDVSTWRDRNRAQWLQMAKECEVLIVCNGKAARLYVNGEPDGLDAPLPYELPAMWSSGPLERLLRSFLDTQVTPVKSVVELSERLAYRTAALRDKVMWLLDQPEGKRSREADMAHAQLQAWRGAIYAEAAPRDFADGIAQVVSYGMVLAALTDDNADRDHDGVITVEEARASIKELSPVMSAAFGPLLERPLYDAVRIELGHLEALISAIDPERVRRSSDARGEPWLYFYEDFLGKYDPAMRKQAGVYYTPTAVVQAMVTIVNHLLVTQFGKRAGFADPHVTTLDPAVGTGTFPLAVIDAAASQLVAQRGPAGSEQAAQNLSRNLFGFELLPGPYSVAHLRLTQRLRELDPDEPLSAKVILTDTLESPDGYQKQIGLWGDARVLADEQNRARRVKALQEVTVVLGNPPYRRVKRQVEGRGSGAWVLTGPTPPPLRGEGSKSGPSGSLFEDVLSVAREAGLGQHLKNVYNQYTYFWRWAIWKVFEHHGDQPGIVAFITGSSWLTGDAFVGLREIARRQCDAIWVLDLGGDNRGAVADENVFAIETPVAIVILSRSEKRRKDPAVVRYRRIVGTAASKLTAMRTLAGSAEPLDGDWEIADSDWRAPFVPPSRLQLWSKSLGLQDIFPWTRAGCKAGRTWVVSTRREDLAARWQELARTPMPQKAVAFKESPSGQKVRSTPPELPGAEAATQTIADLGPDGLDEPNIARYGFRAFDRQWIVADARVLDRPGPNLWSTQSPHQLYLVSLMTGQIGSGPAMVCSALLPDIHYFRGSYGARDVIPLFRDAAATLPNVTRGLLVAIAERLGVGAVNAEHLAAYVYALLSAPAYQTRFAAELRTPGARVPMTADGFLWAEVVALGEELLWLHTFAERFRGKGRGRQLPQAVGHLGWSRTVRTLPQTLDNVHFEPGTRTLHIGDGVVTGVREDVWEFSVSGMQVVRRWLAYRTGQGAGRAAEGGGPLDQIRPTEWADEWHDELLDLLRVLTISADRWADQAALLERVCAGPLIDANTLPQPGAAEHKGPQV